MEKKSNKDLHLRIWVSGLLATIIVLVMWSLLFEGTNFITYVIQGVVFYGTWVILHYLIYRPIYNKLIRKNDNNKQ